MILTCRDRIKYVQESYFKVQRMHVIKIICLCMHHVCIICTNVSMNIMAIDNIHVRNNERMILTYQNRVKYAREKLFLKV